MAASITCPRCQRTSHHPRDVEEGYCGNCHDWTSVCAYCRRRVGPDAPYAEIDIAGQRVTLCSPDEPGPGRPDCAAIIARARSEPDFYEPDEPVADIVARFNAAVAARSAPPQGETPRS